VLSVGVGYDSAYYTGIVGSGREGYYTGASATGEPPGVWHGAGAAELGLVGEIDPELMHAIYDLLLDPRDPNTHDRTTWGKAEGLGAAHKHYQSAEQLYAASLEREPDAGPERRSELRQAAEEAARQAVELIDATFSPAKSVTVTAASFERMANDAAARGDHEAAAMWSMRHAAVEHAVMMGATASVDYLQDVAGYGRVGKHTAGGPNRWVDSHKWVVAQFLQHDSRLHDPQLHVHQVILNRQLCADGKWRALDSRAIHGYKRAAGAMGERVMEAELARSLGLQFETRVDGQAREVVGVDHRVMDLFSERSKHISAKTAELADAFRERYGREPSARDMTMLKTESTLITRNAKEYGGESFVERMDRWEAQCRAEIPAGLAAVAEAVLENAARPAEPATWVPRDVTERALATLTDKGQTWGDSDVTGAVDKALPANLGLAPQDVRPFLESVVAETLAAAIPVKKGETTTNLPSALRLENGRSAYEAPAARRWTAEGVVAAERLLRDAAVLRGAATVSLEQAEEYIARYASSDHRLGEDQAAMLRGILTSGALTETVCAPAGTGKTFAVGAAAEAWREMGRSVVGLATTQNATEELAAEGLDCRNIAGWLKAQERIEQGHPRPGDELFELTPESMVFLDEASMTSTLDLARVAEKCNDAGAKLVFVGDPAQLSPVGPGGALADLAEHGIRYELSTVRRFADQWERDASLRLRAGDKSAIADYDKHGRLRDGGSREETEAAAARAWLADTLAGKESLLLVGTNDAADRIAGQLRDTLVELGMVEEAGVPLGMQGTVAGVGDLVQARRNGWELTGYEGNTRAPINRQAYEVTATRDDGGLVVRALHADPEDPAAKLTLPGSYVDSAMCLAYASTVHAAEGRTVDTGHEIIGDGMDASGALVGLTRGRESNTAWAVTQRTAQDAEPGQVHEVEERSAVGVMRDLLERAEEQRTATAQQEQAAIDEVSTRSHAEKLIDGVNQVLADRSAGVLDALHAEGVLSAHDRERLAGDTGMGALDQLLRRVELAGHDPREALATAVTQQGLDSAQSPAQVLHWRVRTSYDDRLTPVARSHADLIPADVPAEWRPWLTDRADAADDRRRELGAQVAEEGPQWLVEALGAAPEDAIARAEYEHKAGYAAAYREQTGHTAEADPLGSAPPAGLPEKFALWHAGHAALDLPDAGADEAKMSDGQLRNRVRAYERETFWAPKYVGDQLAATSTAADQARVDAQIWGARAEVETEAEAAVQLREAAQAAAAEAELLATRAAQLDKSDTQRADWFIHTSKTREASERARAALGARGVDLDAPAERTTAAEWLAAHVEEQRADERGRPVRDEVELVDEESEAVRAEVDEATTPAFADGLPETALQDIRETAVPDVTELADEAVQRRVPAVDETAEAVDRAHEAAREIQARATLDAQNEDDRHAQQLSAWAAADEAREYESTEWQRDEEPAWEH
jgi:conjugative relaxase-like TrwC/TraI family protein